MSLIKLVDNQEMWNAIEEIVMVGIFVGIHCTEQDGVILTIVESDNNYYFHSVFSGLEYFEGQLLEFISGSVYDYPGRNYRVKLCLKDGTPVPENGAVIGCGDGVCFKVTNENIEVTG